MSGYEMMLPTGKAVACERRKGGRRRRRGGGAIYAPEKSRFILGCIGARLYI